MDNGVGVFDADLIVAGATVTASGHSAAIDLGSGFAPGGGGRPMFLPVNVTAFDHTTGDETYVVWFEDSPDDSTYTARTPSVTVSAAALVTLEGFVHDRYVRLAYTLGGTTPILTFADSYLNPQVNA